MIEKMNCAQLTEKVTQLCAQHADVLTELADLRSNMNDRIQYVINDNTEKCQNYDNKIADLRTDPTH